MMKRRQSKRNKWLVALSTCIACCHAGSLNAGWPEFRRDCHVDKMRNNAWPQPFRALDSVATAAPFEVMKNNGWREFNTVANAFFSESNQLTDAGNLKIQQILQAPQPRRAIYVMRGATPEQTAVRVEAVEIAVSALIPVGDLPPIHVTDSESFTSSGAYQTMVNRALIRTTPTPRLPQFTGQNNPTQNTVAPNANSASGK